MFLEPGDIRAEVCEKAINRIEMNHVKAVAPVVESPP